MDTFTTTIPLQAPPVAPSHLTPDVLDRLAAKHGIEPMTSNFYGTLCIMGAERRYDLSHIIKALAWESVGGAEIAGNDGEA